MQVSRDQQGEVTARSGWISDQGNAVGSSLSHEDGDWDQGYTVNSQIANGASTYVLSELGEFRDHFDKTHDTSYDRTTTFFAGSAQVTQVARNGKGTTLHDKLDRRTTTADWSLDGSPTDIVRLSSNYLSVEDIDDHTHSYDHDLTFDKNAQGVEIVSGDMAWDGTSKDSRVFHSTHTIDRSETSSSGWLDDKQTYDGKITSNYEDSFAIDTYLASDGSSKTTDLYDSKLTVAGVGQTTYKQDFSQTLFPTWTNTSVVNYTDTSNENVTQTDHRLVTTEIDSLGNKNSFGQITSTREQIGDVAVQAIQDDYFEIMDTDYEEIQSHYELETVAGSHELKDNYSFDLSKDGSTLRTRSGSTKGDYTSDMKLNHREYDWSTDYEIAEDHYWDLDVDHSKSYESSYSAQQSYDAGTGQTTYGGSSSATSEGLLQGKDHDYGQGNDWPGTSTYDWWQTSTDDYDTAHSTLTNPDGTVTSSSNSTNHSVGTESAWTSKMSTPQVTTWDYWTSNVPNLFFVSGPLNLISPSMVDPYVHWAGTHADPPWSEEGLETYPLTAGQSLAVAPTLAELPDVNGLLNLRDQESLWQQHSERSVGLVENERLQRNFLELADEVELHTNSPMNPDEGREMPPAMTVATVPSVPHSTIDGFTDVLMRSYDTGAVAAETWREFEGPAPTLNGAVPMETVVRGTQMINGLSGLYSALGQSTPPMELVLDSVFANFGSREWIEELEIIYPDADAGGIRSGIAQMREVDYGPTDDQAALDNLVQRLAEVIVKIHPTTTRVAPGSGGSGGGSGGGGGSGSGGGGGSGGGSGGGGGSGSGGGGGSGSGGGEGEGATELANVALLPYGEGSGGAGPRLVNQSSAEGLDWSPSNPASRRHSPNVLHRDEQMSMAAEGEGGGDEVGGVAVLGTGVVADLNLNNVSLKKLQQLLDQGLAKAYRKDSYVSGSIFFGSRKWGMYPTQYLSKADIVIVGGHDGPKFIIEKVQGTSTQSLGVASGAPAMLTVTTPWTRWQAWTGPAGGAIDWFAAPNNDAKGNSSPFSAGSYQYVADYWAGFKDQIRQENFAGALEFTLNVIPFGGTALEVADNGVTTQAGVMLVTGVATVVIPAAKGLSVAGKISPKVASAAVRTATAAGYAAAGAQGIGGIKDAFGDGVNWDNAGRIVDALLILADVKISSADALKSVNLNKATAAEMVGTNVPTVTRESLVESAHEAARRVIPTIQDTCFAAGTPVLTPSGSRLIETLQAGEEVLARGDNDPDSSPRPRLIEEVFELSATIIELHVGGQVIETTAEHPFYVAEVGWRPAFELQAGDKLLGHDGRTASVERVIESDRTVRVYNLRVTDDHTYFVGSAAWGFSVWVHNTYRVVASTEFPGKFKIVEDLPDGSVRDVHDDLIEGVAKARAQSGNDLKAAESALIKDTEDGLSRWGLNPQVFTETTVFTPTTGRSYKVFQRNDIDWDKIRTKGPRDFIGKSNAEAAKEGLRPQLNEKDFATLHHAEQNANGPLFEASTRYHHIKTAQKAPLHPFGRKGHPYSPMGNGPGSRRQEFQDLESPEYWQWREENR